MRTKGKKDSTTKKHKYLVLGFALVFLGLLVMGGVAMHDLYNVEKYGLMFIFGAFECMYLKMLYLTVKAW